MGLSDFDYNLPSERIAQEPLAERDSSRMLVLGRSSGDFDDSVFIDLPDLLYGNELMVVNNTRVISARLFGHRARVRSELLEKDSSRRPEVLSSRIEVLLVRRTGPDLWDALVRPGRKVQIGEVLDFEGTRLTAEVVGRGEYGVRHLRFHSGGNVLEEIERIGHTPLPPYIRRVDRPQDRDRYQTVFAKLPGAVAAPTAGLHFTPAILQRLKQRGVEIAEITLEVGLGTFQPIRDETLENHRMHAENYEISEAAATSIALAKQHKRPILAIGTTVVRALEDAAQRPSKSGLARGTITAGRGVAEIFIRPGHQFQVVDQLLTNFHLPRSTLLVLVATFAGRERILAAYNHAIASGYRFYSYGDCMLIR
jgi:S-adenosylmethionine:tRNA ribosyltransferase-isomerase